MYKWREGKLGIANAFVQGLEVKKEPLECIMDSEFIRSFINVDKIFENKNSKHFQVIARQLLSLSILDETYGLYL